MKLVTRSIVLELGNEMARSNLDLPTAPTETTRLIPNSQPTSESTVRTQPRNLSKRFRNSIFSPHRVCISSRVVVLIYAWTFVIGALYEGTTVTADLLIHGLKHVGIIVSPVHFIVGVYLLLAIATMFYPLAGYIADVWCGRYRVVMVSLLLMWACLLSALIMAIPVTLLLSDHSIRIVFQWIFGTISFALCIAALAGFTSNIVQLGFDQLMDEPSHSLGMFVHWYIWYETLGITIIRVFNIVVRCTKKNEQAGDITKKILYSSPGAFLLILSILLLASVFAYRHFHTERAQKNPYKLILQILNFVRKNKYPVSPPSAFVYTYHRIPTRLDYAKQVYGGPFNNSDVDDVRTFIRVLTVLIALGPIFILQVPISYTIFPQFALHSGMEVVPTPDNLTCSADWILLESGSLSFFIFIVFFPVYIWLVYSVLRNRMPKILTRLGFSSALLLLAVISMLAIDLSGHLILHSEGNQNMTCMFLQSSLSKFEHLHLSWTVLILPNIVLGFAPHILLATALEFISAEGPHSMKGVLVGALFASKGFYQLVGASLVYLFSLRAWSQGVLKQVSSFISCEFVYFLVTVVIALVGLVCFVVSACKYKYRVRGEEEFSQSDVEEVFERRLRLQQEYNDKQVQEMRSCDDDALAEYEDHGPHT